MTITREINGVLFEFDLTPGEIYDAYLIQEHKFDTDDVVDAIDTLTDEECLECYGVSLKTFFSYIDEMATEKRRNQDKYEMSWNYARDEAIRTVLARHQSEKKQ